ncbi:ectonucleoside triphosphate diphosphohydrolase 2-like [Lampris incognitus]|uniref:ectonucleoside triphosphate diphosphohydrolase 2-like n=1 Tax=Lampris incognitus TaxID=2546036 RepID=UPI0024B62F46|nr:ectonucleoside triphosphate diphosphohydrolase 2-like [Lampris incognitus]
MATRIHVRSGLTQCLLLAMGNQTSESTLVLKSGKINSSNQSPADAPPHVTHPAWHTGTLAAPRALPTMATQRRHLAFLSALALLGTVGILLTVIPTEETKGSPENRYGVVFDAGSSHTSMYIYKWPADKQNGTGIVSQHSECHVEGGGISSYTGSHGRAAHSLESCLKQAMMDIPKSKHHSTPLYLGATAGMRLLNETSHIESEKILEEVGSKLRSYPFNFSGATILSGQEEGAYGWVTVNYLLENLVKYGFIGRWVRPNRETVGALDLGGASTQITFETPEKVEDKNNVMELRLYGRDYQLYTQSFLCYGKDQVLRRLMALLITTQGLAGTLSHPCYPADFNTSLHLGRDIFDSPCVEKYRPASFDPQLSITVQGSGNYQSCLGNITRIFSFDRCSYSKCSFDGVFQSSVTGNFMAFSAFFYTQHLLQRIAGTSITHPCLLKEANDNVCNMTFSEMLIKAPDQKKHLKDFCAMTTFMQVLLLKGYGFDELSFPHISFQKKAGDTSVGWALGYMLTQSSLVPGEDTALIKALPPGAWAGILFLFVLLLIVVLGYFASMTCQKKGDGRII